MNGPSIQTGPSSIEEMAQVATRITQLARERDEAAAAFRDETQRHDKTLYKLREMTKERDRWRSEYMVAARVAARYAELVLNIHLLSAKAAEMVESARKEGLLEAVAAHTPEAEHKTPLPTTSEPQQEHSDVIREVTS